MTPLDNARDGRKGYDLYCAIRRWELLRRGAEPVASDAERMAGVEALMIAMQRRAAS